MSAHDCLVGEPVEKALNWELKTVLTWSQFPWSQDSSDLGPITYLSLSRFPSSKGCWKFAL